MIQNSDAECAGAGRNDENPSMETNPSLLLKLRSKEDSQAWTRFVTLYTPLVDRWIGQLGFGDPDRSDLVQEVFVVLLGKISSFQLDPARSFRAWLRTVTINKCRDLARKQARRVEPQFVETIERAAADDTELLTQQEYRDYLAHAALQMMRQHFSESTWRACWEHVAMGRPAKEVAQQLGVTENAVYLARGRVLRRLRDELEGLWD